MDTSGPHPAPPDVTLDELVKRWLGPDGRTLERTVDDIVALYLSSSSTAPHLFGDRLEDFVADLRRVLLDTSETSLFSVRLPDNTMCVWRPR